MFCIKCALVKKTLLEWFNRKFKSHYLQISPFDKFRYERNVPIGKMINVLYANFD